MLNPKPSFPGGPFYKQYLLIAHQFQDHEARNQSGIRFRSSKSKGLNDILKSIDKPRTIVNLIKKI